MSDITGEKIDLSFDKNSLEFNKYIYPSSYYTFSHKERLILLTVEKFRTKFQFKYPKRKPLVLVVKNECDVQKFVCMTIRPTTLILPKIIGSLEDFITYEPLKSSILLPERLISPDTLIRWRKGNSFEIATLLCSILIGEGFNAMVVSGTAKYEIASNDQRNMECPYLETIEQNLKENINQNMKSIFETKYMKVKYSIFDSKSLLSKATHINNAFDKCKFDYSLKEIPNLTSKFSKHRSQSENNNNTHGEKTASLTLEEKSVNFYKNEALHAWVLIIEKCENKVFFIEPSTGFKHDRLTENYIQIDSVWNHENYYVNCQKVNISEMNWDFTKEEDWESFFPNRANEIKNYIDVGSQINFKNIAMEKKLDLIPSWVQKLNVNLEDCQQRYPNYRKIINYKRVIHERFSPYYQIDGLCTRITIFDDDDYLKEKIRYEYYQNRADCLIEIKFNFVTKEIEKYFSEGRMDKLKTLKHYQDSFKKSKVLIFYHKSRIDSLRECYLDENKIIYHFDERNDLCVYQEFCLNHISSELEKLTDIFHRNENVPSDRDIAIRHFCLKQNKIIIKYHYSIGATIASKKEFTRPIKPDYGQEIILSSNLIKSYKTTTYENSSDQYENYLLLLKLLNDEKNLKMEYEKRIREINDILVCHFEEIKQPCLKFDMFDPLRNQNARNFSLKKFEKEIERNLENMVKDPDFLEPYLISYNKSKLTYEESLTVFNMCLNDIKSRYTNLLNELQRKYESLISELKVLKKFQSKFCHQLNDSEFKDLEKQSKNIELQKRIIQERIIRTHEKFQIKYEEIKNSLLNDSRL